GRASGIAGIPTPDAQLLGRHRFSLLWLAADDLNAVSQRSRRWRTPLFLHQKQDLYMLSQRLERFQLPPAEITPPAEYSLFSLSGNSELSCCKKALNSNEVVIRVFNPGQTIERAAVRSKVFRNYRPASLAEQPVGKSSKKAEDDKIRPNQAATWLASW
ncbi:MAG: hypothetical protein N3A57_03360, partial [Negativicutes bacterium]|nr:hypothetical protein [Negativicutes bacterium]